MYCLMCRKETKFIKELNYNADLYYCEDCDIGYPTAKEFKKDIDCPYCQKIFSKKIDGDYANILCRQCNQIYHVEKKYYSEKLLLGYYISKKVD